MNALSKLSKRELWLVSMLPAVLVVIASFVVPRPADEVHELEEQLDRITQADPPGRTVQRAQEARSQIREHEASLEALARQAGELNTTIEAARRPAAPAATAASASASLAENLDELRARLARYGVRVLAIDSKGSAARRPSSAPLSSETWRVTAVGRWGEVRDALNQPGTFPAGLVLRSMQMDEPSSRTTLRRWEFSVAPAGGRP
ncbi:MAG: hypothetical protein AAF800_03715 [Planctomycetota bacterium]